MMQHSNTYSKHIRASEVSAGTSPSTSSNNHEHNTALFPSSVVAKPIRLGEIFRLPSSTSIPSLSSEGMQKAAAKQLLRRHPLQRLPAPSRDSSAALHVLGLASFAYSFSWLIRNPNPINDSYGWHLQYLTIVGLTLSTITFIIALLADLTLSPTLFKIKNYLSVASAPMECLITLLYWGLRAIDPKLVLNEFAPPLHFSTDFSFHGTPAISLVTDLLFFSPPYTIAFLPALGLSGCIAFGYWLWIERCYSFNKFYPYPLFEMLTAPQRIGLFAASALLMTLATALLTWMYGMINGHKIEHVPNGDLSKVRSGNVKGQ